MKNKIWFLAAMGAICLGFIAGCATSVGAGVTYSKITGELKHTAAASLDKTWKATEKAFKELEMQAEAKEKDALAARIEATGAGGKLIVVKLRNRGEKLTEVVIRVGLVGDEEISRKILEKINANL